MPTKSWTLTDTADGTHHDDIRISAADMPSAGDGWSVTKRTLRGGLQDGVELVEVDTGRMRLAILPTRGMGIWRAELPSGEKLGWKSPVHGPVHPKFVPVAEPSGLGWLDGFDELMVRCGLESNGAPVFDDAGRLLYPLHGHLANRPALKVEVVVDDSAGTITVRGVVEECRFHFQKLRLTASVTAAIGSTSFTLDDEVENFGGTPAGMQMLYHINFGEPLLGDGAELVAPIREIAPHDPVATANVDMWNKYGPPVAGAPEQCFFFDLLADENSQTQVLIKNRDSSTGAAIRFNTNDLPYFTQWKNMVASSDGYVTGLEPATNFPNPRDFEKQQGRVVELAAGQTWSTQVTIDWLTSANEVATTEQAVRKLQGDTAATVHREPLAKWTR
ncbi:MAG: aldose 1-epimerase family protein [Planctomycetes bacterium]|nr:aldose 1-epimerase family protein [Planctomycetota bacterium]